MKKKRLDDILIERGVVEDREGAFVIVTEGRVLVSGQKAVSGAQMITEGINVEVKAIKPYVGRGAYKLEAALTRFEIIVRDRVCLDIGTATGGFTEVLLNRGAKKVYAVDTAKGKIALKLREDSRVLVMDETDIRTVKKLPETIEVVTIDVSLVPLRDIMPHVKRFLAPGGDVVALLKPQYETRDPRVLRHGVIKNTRDRNSILDSFLSTLPDEGWTRIDYIESPIRGSEGNIEYLLHIQMAPN